MMRWLHFFGIVSVLGMVAFVADCDHGRSDPFEPPAASVAASAPGEVTAKALVPAKPVAHIEESCATICNKNATCGGLTGETLKTNTRECMLTCINQGKGDPMAGPVVAQAMGAVADKCNKVACEQFPTCYMDTLEQVQTDLIGPSKPSPPVSPEMRARFIATVCKVVAEHPGHIPDLNASNASPAAQELKALAGQLAAQAGSVDQVADLMKEAIATCGQ